MMADWGGRKTLDRCLIQSVHIKIGVMGFKFRMDVVSVFGGISCKCQEFCRILLFSCSWNGILINKKTTICYP